LLLGQVPGLVPLLSELPAPADVRNYPNASTIETEPPCKIKTWLHADAVTAVTVKQHRIIPVELCSLFENDVQWNLRAILRGRHFATNFDVSK
jgi:hypothetical protein